MEILVSRHLLVTCVLLKSVDVSFLSLGNLKRLLNIQPLPLTWGSFPLSVPVNRRFGFFYDYLILSVCSLPGCLVIILLLKFLAYLAQCSPLYSHSLSSAWSILPVFSLHIYS